MSIGKALAAKIRHRIGFAPHHIVENPEAKILKNGAHTKDIVIGADDPDRTGVLENAAGLG